MRYYVPIKHTEKSLNFPVTTLTSSRWQSGTYILYEKSNMRTALSVELILSYVFNIHCGSKLDFFVERGGRGLIPWTVAFSELIYLVI